VPGTGGSGVSPSVRGHPARIDIPLTNFFRQDPGVRVRPLDEPERPWLAERLQAGWGAVHIARLGELRDASVLPAMVAERDGVPLGLLTYEVVGDAFEVMSIESWDEGSGVGTSLLVAAFDAARAAGCRRVWLITTNDNLRALRFYQRRGMRLVRVHRDAVAQARALKPSIPVVGHHGIGVTDELELELRLR
jgi:GNAT superfamily N-acetyltransferase